MIGEARRGPIHPSNICPAGGRCHKNSALGTQCPETFRGLRPSHYLVTGRSCAESNRSDSFSAIDHCVTGRYDFW